MVCEDVLVDGMYLKHDLRIVHLRHDQRSMEHWLETPSRKYSDKYYKRLEKHYKLFWKVSKKFRYHKFLRMIFAKF
jgi:hypothetical protein